jgi:hypothetical protein
MTCEDRFRHLAGLGCRPSLVSLIRHDFEPRHFEGFDVIAFNHARSVSAPRRRHHPATAL